MNVPREQIAQALLTLLQGINTNISYGPAQFPAGSITRRGAIWSKTAPANQPCLYVVQVAEHTSQESAFGENRWVLYFTLEVYAQADAASAAVPDTLINAILDGIELTIQSKPKGMPQTLGGIVTNCWIEGEIVLGTGQIETQLMMLVPVRIVTGI